MEKAPILTDAKMKKILSDECGYKIEFIGTEERKRIQRDSDHTHYEAEYAKLQPFSEENIAVAIIEAMRKGHEAPEGKRAMKSITLAVQAIMSLRQPDDICEECKGETWIWVNYGWDGYQQDVCPTCHGTGKKQPDEKVRDKIKTAFYAYSHYHRGEMCFSPKKQMEFWSRLDEILSELRRDRG